MPIYEFRCKKCGKIFEQLFFPSDKTENILCPFCGANGPDKLMSSFSCNSTAGGNASASSSCASQGGFS
ncbi:MAG: zinc ribbon domain-containing protein [Deltaproteobacteria bacterium]|nr:zinc ribbon domain-containing protein [Deltaproteobacteria bacterium]